MIRIQLIFVYCFNLCSQNLGDSAISATKLFIFSNEKGKTISYMPDLSNEESCGKHFKNIGTKILELNNNVNNINATKSIRTNILSSTNISQLWNLLTSSKNISCSVINFKIGDINGEKATIICTWYKVFQKQFIPFINQVTGGGGSKGGAPIVDEDVDYDELPFKIYKIECDDALAIEKECNLLN